MRLLLIQNSLYYPAFGGGNKSNRLLMEALAARGHECTVITRVSESEDATARDRVWAELGQVAGAESGPSLVRFRLNGVEVHTLAGVAEMRRHMLELVEQARPDWALASTDDPLQLFLPALLDRLTKRVMYLVRATVALPFGPDAVVTSEAKTETLRRVAGAMAVSRYAADYVEQYAGIPAVAMPISLHGTGPFPRLGVFGKGFITMVNPCAVKGASIFLQLARRFPQFPFAAVPTWGTTEEDLAALRRLSNVAVLEPSEEIDTILRQSRIILAPSLCADAKPRIVTEALSRGVPVIAADVGGVAEAMLGLDYLLPVRPVSRYRTQVNAQMLPEAVVPPQDVDPWCDALERLLTDRAHYEQLSERAHMLAGQAVGRLSVELVERYLQLQMHTHVRPLLQGALASQKSSPQETSTDAAAASAAAPPSSVLTSAEMRALIAMRLRNQRSR